MSLRKADADIRLAELLISPIGNPTNDEVFYDMAAYHAQQAIEKALKYILHDKFGMDNTLKKFRTHKIYDLINMLQDYGYIVSDNLKAMAITITEWEAQSRYNDDLLVTRNEITDAISLYKELREQINKL